MIKEPVALEDRAERPRVGDPGRHLAALRELVVAADYPPGIAAHRSARVHIAARILERPEPEVIRFTPPTRPVIPVLSDEYR